MSAASNAGVGLSELLQLDAVCQPIRETPLCDSVTMSDCEIFNLKFNSKTLILQNTNFINVRVDDLHVKNVFFILNKIKYLKPPCMNNLMFY